MKFEAYDQLNMTQKDQFSKISNKLLSHCFICRDIENDKSDYYFIERNSKLFETYFSLIDWEVDLDSDNGVAHLINLQNRNRYNFKLLESIILLAIRLIYHEKRQELNQTDDIIMTMDDLHVKLNTFSMQDRLVDKTSILSAMRLFRQFHLIEIIDTKKENNFILHFAKQLPENIEAGFVAKVNTDLRTSTSKNHSATHLMHLALRNILGTHVEQKGSLVNPNYLRFDFSHFSKVSDEELRQVEASVNQQIEAQLQLVEHRNIPIKEALDKGAMALFGEKYGDNVRMIEFGDSKELCGGIHVKNTADIWHFKIVSEGAVAAGIRRIEAITGDAVKDFYKNQEDTLAEIKEVLKNPQDVLKSVGITSVAELPEIIKPEDFKKFTHVIIYFILVFN